MLEGRADGIGRMSTPLRGCAASARQGPAPSISGDSADRGRQLPLTIAFIFILISLLWPQSRRRSWQILGTPLVAVIMLLLHHLHHHAYAYRHAGIIEDYVHGEATSSSSYGQHLLRDCGALACAFALLMPSFKVWKKWRARSIQ